MSEDRAEKHFHVMHMLDMYRASALAVAAVQSGVLDLLASGPLTVEEIVETLNLHAGTTHRFVRNLVAMNYLKQDGDQYDLDEVGRALTEDSPFRLREKALLIGSEYAASWFGLHHALEKGKSAYEELHGGETVWEHRGEDDVVGPAFTRMMHLNIPGVLRALEDFPFEEFSTLVDFGGADGQMLRTLLERYPRLNGVLVDAAAVVAEVQETERFKVRSSDLLMRMGLVGVEDADLGMLSHVLHDWPLKEAVKILHNAMAALGDASDPQTDPKLLVVERTVADPATPLDAMRDLHMMAITGGQERTRQEFEDLFEMAGLEVCKEGEMWKLLQRKVL